MTRKIWRQVSWPIVFAALAAPFMVDCGGLPKVPGVPGIPGVGNCPDMANIEAVESFDFAGEFKLKADVAGKIKAGLGAALEMQKLAAKIDADLTTACGNLAKDLGDTGSYKNAQDACKAAVKAIGDAKAKLGASASIKLDMTEPHCGLDVGVYGDCAAKCDATVKPGSAEVTCEGGKMQGSCSASCTGDCEMQAAAACSGECSGTCDADVSGSCDGNCSGKCDGKATTGGSSGAQCAGKCEGKCSGNVKGSCKGKCGGTCHLSAGASCSGTCTGDCSVKMQAPKCTGTVKPPQMSADCKAKCDAKVQANASCTPPHIALRITGAADAAAAAKFQAAIEKNLGAVLDVSIGMAKNVGAIAASVKVVAEGATAAVQTAASGGDKMAGVALTACVLSPFKGAIDAAASVQASVNVSVNVQASASGSASGKAG
ncbi:MAG TPA: hypothetical protein VIF09_29655 [Polyangiaceae bacterium]